MNHLSFVGRMAAAAVTSHHAGTTVTKFRLIRNEHRGSDEEGNVREEEEVAIPFVAFGARGEALAKNCLTGDQVIVQASISNNVFERDGKSVYDYNFRVTKWEFGAPGQAKREQLNRQRG